MLDRPTDGLSPHELDAALHALARAQELDPEHPDAIAIQRATAGLYKSVRRKRRSARRDAVLAHDDAITAKTATAAPDRIDDETDGLPLASRAQGATAGTLIEARACYVCKERYVVVDAFYHQLCPSCATTHHAKRDQRTDLSGRRALLTGGRAKIGMYIALRLLRDGAHTTITTRFPRDAVRRFASMPDYGDWQTRLTIVGIDLRDPAQVLRLADDVAAQGSLDILINNAAQTVRRSPEAYAPLVAGEQSALPDVPLPRVITMDVTGPGAATVGLSDGLTTDASTPTASAASTESAAAPSSALAPADGGDLRTAYWAPTPHALTALALKAASASPARIAANIAIDAGGLLPDLHHANSWSQVVGEIDPIEMLEVQLCNSTAPFLLVDRLRPALAASPARRTYVVNVSAMEGQFSRGYKGPGHPHTNMAKAALNMLTRTSAQELLERDGILMTAVDTGWITDERPHPQKMRLADSGFHAPLDLVDGAARVYDPVVRGEAGEDLYGCFLKDYKPSAW